MPDGRPEGIDEVEEKDLVLIGDVFRSMTKTIKAFTTYPPNNPIYQKFSTELFEKFNAFFISNDSLPLKVEQFSLSYKEKEVFHSDDRNDNVALMLFVDGIREICFHKGLTLEEVIDFINVLRIASRGGNLDDDVVTLMWEKDMEHFSYFVPEAFGEEELNITENIASTTEEPSTTIMGASYSDITVRPVTLDLKVPPPTDEEITPLRERLQEIEGDNLLSAATELFFEMMISEKDIEGFGEITKNIGMILDIFLEKNMLTKVIDLLSRLREFSETDIMTEHKNAIDNVIDKAGDEKIIGELMGGSYDPEDIKRYLLLLNKAAITPLLHILGELEDRKMRRLICNVLAILGKQDIKTLAEGLKDKRWYLVRNTMLILGMIKEPSAIKYIEDGMKHPEVRVRREAIKVLETVGTKKALIAGLKDTDSSIKMSALKALRRLGGNDVFEFIKDIVLREDFKERPFSEKKELLEAFGDLNKEASLPIIAGFFKRKGLFRKIKNKELAACAAYGLGAIGTPDAIALLEKEKDSKDSLLRESCRKAIRVAGKK